MYFLFVLYYLTKYYLKNIFTGDPLRGEEITETPNMLPIRRNKQAKIETLEDGSGNETVLLKEQQRNDRNSEIFSLTKLQNGKVVDVKKWLIKY